MRSRWQMAALAVFLWSLMAIGAALQAATFAGVPRLTSGPAPILLAQDAQRDCQTVRTCRYDRAGPYRGCLSSYTCRICKFVQSRCRTDGSRRVCQEMRCSWGG